MSQFNAPPPPPGNVPPNMGQPPGYGQPGYGQPGYGQPPSKMSISAIISLICGILGCIPAITSLLAVILGIVGIRATGKPGVTGRGFAIAGLILGLLGLLIWGVIGGVSAWAYVASGPAREAANSFFADLSAGRVTEAAAISTIDPEDLAAASQQLQSYGTLGQSFSVGFNVQSDAASGTRALVVKSAQFGTQTKSFLIELRKEGEAWKVSGLQEQNGNLSAGTITLQQ